MKYNVFLKKIVNNLEEFYLYFNRNSYLFKCSTLSINDALPTELLVEGFGSHFEKGIILFSL